MCNYFQIIINLKGSHHIFVTYMFDYEALRYFCYGLKHVSKKGYKSWNNFIKAIYKNFNITSSDVLNICQHELSHSSLKGEV